MTGERAKLEITVTNAWLATRIANIAREASTWTAEICSDESHIAEPMSADAARRFIERIRERIGWIERMIEGAPDA